MTGSNGEKGMATVELALTLPVIAVLLLSLIFAGQAGAAKLSAEEAARTAARMLSIGDTPAAAQAAAAKIAGAGAAFRISADEGFVTVRVEKTLFVPWLPASLSLVGQSSMPEENRVHT